MFDVIVGVVCGAIGFYLGLVTMACAVDRRDNRDE